MTEWNTLEIAHGTGAAGRLGKFFCASATRYSDRKSFRLIEVRQGFIRKPQPHFPA